MEDVKVAPLVPGMTPEQTQHFMALDKEMRVLLPAIVRCYAGKRFLNTSILGSLAAAAAGVIKTAPPEHRQNLFDAHTLSIRDAAFDVFTHVQPVAAPDVPTK